MKKENLNHAAHSQDDYSRDIPFERSSTGAPCLWERGGRTGNTGFAQVVADSNGFRKTAVYVNDADKPDPEYQQWDSTHHALIPVEVGDIVITAELDHGDLHLLIERIRAIRQSDLVMELAYPPLLCTDGIQKAAEKACTYNHENPVFIVNPINI